MLDAADLFEAPVEDAPCRWSPRPSPSRRSPTRSPSHSGLETIEEVVETAAPAGPAAIDLDVLAVADRARSPSWSPRYSRTRSSEGAQSHPPPSVQERLLPRLPGHGSPREGRERADVDAGGACRRLQELRRRLSSVPASLPALGRLKTQDRGQGPDRHRLVRSHGRRAADGHLAAAGRARAAVAHRAGHERGRGPRAARDGRARARDPAGLRPRRWRTQLDLLRTARPRGAGGQDRLLGRTCHRLRDPGGRRRCSSILGSRSARSPTSRRASHRTPT